MTESKFDYEQYTDQVAAAIEKGWSKTAIAKHLEITRVTFDKRLKRSNWKSQELKTLSQLGIIL